MGNFARTPCDEATILAGSCERSAAMNGPWILAATILGSSMAFIDGTVVNVALPALQSALSATIAEVQWVVESYALFLAALILIGGSMGDLYGRRKIFAAGVVLFSIASAWCGLAPDIRQLIVARAIQGIGGALLVPGSLALISANFPEKQRGRAIGTWSGFTSITTAVGPVLGGWFTEHGSWRWVFFINVPIGLAVVLLALWKVPESRASEQGQQFDWLGGLLAALGFGGIVFALIESVPVVGAIGGIVLVALLYWEARSSSPMVPLNLFRSRNFSGAKPAHFIPLLRLDRCPLLFPPRFDTGAGLLGYGSGGRSAAFYTADVPAFALVWRTSRSIRGQGSAGNRSPDRGSRILVIIEAGY
jgi:EmrB/QacA subfamily drug resistance transporter